MSILRWLSRRKPVDPDARRRSLLATGRITDGIILDCETNADGAEIAYYSYTLNGVDFVSSDILTVEQRVDRIKYAPGNKVGIRYDRQNQGNSIIE